MAKLVFFPDMTKYSANYLRYDKLSHSCYLARFWLRASQKLSQTLIEFEIMNIKPLADRVLVLPAPAEEKIGGIIIPDTAKEKPLHGKIVATGKGTKDE